MEEQTMLRILDKFIWYSNRNRLFEAKRYVQQELDNIKGITETKCKRRKINKLYCNTCKNCNCKLNANPEYKENKMDKTQIIDILQEVKETLLENDIGKCLEKISEFTSLDDYARFDVNAFLNERMDSALASVQNPSQRKENTSPQTQGRV